MLEELKDVFENVNKWLSFAELKNGSIIGFNIALISAMNEILGEEGLMCIVNVVLIISIMISISSFLPNQKSKLDKKKLDKKKLDKKNLIFYKDIYGFEAQEYIKAFYMANNVIFKDNEIRQIEIDYVNEIITNSQITVYKNNLFKLACIVTISALVITIVSVVCA